MLRYGIPLAAHVLCSHHTHVVLKYGTECSCRSDPYTGRGAPPGYMASTSKVDERSIKGQPEVHGLGGPGGLADDDSAARSLTSGYPRRSADGLTAAQDPVPARYRRSPGRHCTAQSLWKGAVTRTAGSGPAPSAVRPY